MLRCLEDYKSELEEHISSFTQRPRSLGKLHISKPF